MRDKIKVKTEARISAIIPVWKEGTRINELLNHLKDFEPEDILEVIIVDGDKDGSTIKKINKKPGKEKRGIAARIQAEISPLGRATQLNHGAKKARGNWLLFLHADTHLPKRAFKIIKKIAKERKFLAGAFDLGIDSKKYRIKLIKIMANVRSHITRIPYGDQAIFIQRKYFEELGAYPEIPLMEDLELMRRIKKDKKPIILVPEKVMTSSRRWDKEGAFYGTLRNWSLATLYVLGIKPEKLARFYTDKHR